MADQDSSYNQAHIQSLIVSGRSQQVILDSALAANILNSPRAVEISVFVVRAFVGMRNLLGETHDLACRLNALEKELKDRQDVHESGILSMLQRSLDVIDPPLPAKIPVRKRIGFTVKKRSAVCNGKKKR